MAAKRAQGAGPRAPAAKKAVQASAAQTVGEVLSEIEQRAGVLPEDLHDRESGTCFQWHPGLETEHVRTAPAPDLTLPEGFSGPAIQAWVDTEAGPVLIQEGDWVAVDTEGNRFALRRVDDIEEFTQIAVAKVTEPLEREVTELRRDVVEARASLEAIEIATSKGRAPSTEDLEPESLDALSIAAAMRAALWIDHTNVFARHYAALSEAAKGLATLKRARGGDQLC